MADPDRRRLALVDRRGECAALNQLLADVIAGESRVTVLRGAPGVGKSALLGYLSDRLDGWHVAKAAGVEWEMELAYSGLHQLCGPILDQLGRLPSPQRDALATVFGQSSGPAPDRFLVGISTLSLLANVAEERPLACIVDDAQWLDPASAEIVGFVARRLAADRIALVCASRTGMGHETLDGLPQTVIDGLAESDARELLLSSLSGPLDDAICSQIIAESRGNPLALVELPRTWNLIELAGGFALPGDQPVTSKIERSYEQRISELPSDTRLMLVAAAAEPLGDPILLRRAIERLGVGMAAASPAVSAGLVQIHRRVEFAHPLVRSTVYRTASPDDRYRVHRALAEATSAETDPDRRAWHRARASDEPNEGIATELEQSADRAQARGGVAAAAAFLQRAVALSVDPVRRTERALGAAQASLRAGAFEAALAALNATESGPVDDFQRALADLLRAHIAFAFGVGREAPPLLLKAGRGIEPFSVDLARETFLIAWVAAIFAGDVAGEAQLNDISRAVRALPAQPGEPTPLDLLVDGLAQLITDGHGAAASTLQRAAQSMGALSADEVIRWGWAATAASDSVWDSRTTRTIADRHVQLVRNVGALAQLPVVLAAQGNAATLSGDFPGAELVIAEAEGIGAATGTRFAPYTALRLLALQGREREARDLIDSTLEHAAADGQGLAAKNAHWAAAVLGNGLGRYDEAAIAARLATAPPFEPFVSMWALPELIEAAARTGDVEGARVALDRLSATTQPCATDFGLGIEARCRAILTDVVHDELHLEAIERLGRAQLRPDLGRAQLLYGERLRRFGRRSEARGQLRSAHDMFAAIGMGAFRERARRELVATGGKPRRRDEARNALTPQEEQIARLARDGLTNQAIGEMLFLSPRTVEWHLSKVFVKVGVTSRSSLIARLPTVEGESSSV